MSALEIVGVIGLWIVGTIALIYAVVFLLAVTIGRSGEKGAWTAMALMLWCSGGILVVSGVGLAIYISYLIGAPS